MDNVTPTDQHQQNTIAPSHHDSSNDFKESDANGNQIEADKPTESRKRSRSTDSNPSVSDQQPKDSRDDTPQPPSIDSTRASPRSSPASRELDNSEGRDGGDSNKMRDAKRKRTSAHEESLDGDREAQQDSASANDTNNATLDSAAASTTNNDTDTIANTEATNSTQDNNVDTARDSAHSRSPSKNRSRPRRSRTPPKRSAEANGHGRHYSYPYHRRQSPDYDRRSPRGYGYRGGHQDRRGSGRDPRRDAPFDDRHRFREYDDRRRWPAHGYKYEHYDPRSMHYDPRRHSRDIPIDWGRERDRDRDYPAMHRSREYDYPHPDYDRYHRSADYVYDSRIDRDRDRHGSAYRSNDASGRPYSHRHTHHADDKYAYDTGSYPSRPYHRDDRDRSRDARDHHRSPGHHYPRQHTLPANSNTDLRNHESDAHRPSKLRDDETAVAEPKLPPGWVRYFTDDGRPYYHNEARKSTQWDFPEEV